MCVCIFIKFSTVFFHLISFHFSLFFSSYLCACFFAQFHSNVFGFYHYFIRHAKYQQFLLIFHESERYCKMGEWKKERKGEINLIPHFTLRVSAKKMQGKVCNSMGFSHFFHRNSIIFLGDAKKYGFRCSHTNSICAAHLHKSHTSATIIHFGKMHSK